jgi:hypothetical protein
MLRATIFASRLACLATPPIGARKVPLRVPRCAVSMTRGPPIGMCSKSQPFGLTTVRPVCLDRYMNENVNKKGTTMVFISIIGIRLGTDPYFQDGHTPQSTLDKIVDYAGVCPSCEDFCVYGGFDDYCIDCV